MRNSGRSWPLVCICIVSTYDIGFPGWPEPNLDSVPGLGRQFKKRGLAPAPFFIFSMVSQGCPRAVNQSGFFLCNPRLSAPQIEDWATAARIPPSPSHGRTRFVSLSPQKTYIAQFNSLGPLEHVEKAAAEKNERPVGAPAARAWGWRVDVIRSWFAVPLAPLRSRGATRQPGANNTQAFRSLQRPIQLPTTTVRLRPATFCVDRPPGPVHPVLPVPPFHHRIACGDSYLN